jgi:hypothetical protein
MNPSDDVGVIGPVAPFSPRFEHFAASQNVLGEMRDRRVAQLMQRPAARSGTEDLFRATVGQPRMTGHRADVDGGRRSSGWGSSIGQEDRARRAAAIKRGSSRAEPV